MFNHKWVKGLFVGFTLGYFIFFGINPSLAEKKVPVAKAKTAQAPAAQTPVKKPDLSVTNLVLSKESAALGENVEIRADIIGTGNQSFGPIKVRFYFGKKRIGNDQVIVAGPALKQTVKTTVKAEPQGTHDISVIIDPLNEINEKDETNNAVKKTIIVNPPLVAPSSAPVKSGDQRKATSKGKPIGLPVPGPGHTGEVSSGTTRLADLPRIKIIEQNGGETLHTRNQKFYVKWRITNRGDANRINITYLKGGVSMYEFHCDDVASHGREGTCTAVLSPHSRGFVSGNDYRLRLELVKISAEAPLVVASDESDSNFTVVDDWALPEPASGCIPGRPIRVVTPQIPGISWNIGTEYLIQWCTQDTSVANVKVLLKRDADSGGGSWVISDSTPNTAVSDRSSLPGLFWTVPGTVGYGTGYRIRVETLDGSLFAESENAFYINAWLTLDAPNGGQTWYKNRSHTIRWRSGGLGSGLVNIKIIIGAYNQTIATGIANTGSYTWRIPNDFREHSECKIIVEIPIAGGGAFRDSSDATFAIGRAPVIKF